MTSRTSGKCNLVIDNWMVIVVWRKVSDVMTNCEQVEDLGTMYIRKDLVEQLIY